MGCPTVIIGDVGMGGAGTAQGQALRAAKKSGTPFCEDCRKKAKENAQKGILMPGIGIVSPSAASNARTMGSTAAAAGGGGGGGGGGRADEEKSLLEGRWGSDYFGESSVDVSHKWIDKEDEWVAKKWGNDQNNFKLANAGYSVSSGFSYGEGEYSFDAIKASAHFDTASAQAGKDWKYAGVEGKIKALSGEAEASLGAEWSQKAKDVHAKIGASVDLVKAEVGGKVKIPCFGHQIIIGLGAEGQVGAAAEAKLYAGWSEEDGYGIGAKAKLGAGVGAGLNFSLGFK